MGMFSESTYEQLNATLIRYVNYLLKLNLVAKSCNQSSALIHWLYYIVAFLLPNTRQSFDKTRLNQNDLAYIWLGNK